MHNTLQISSPDTSPQEPASSNGSRLPRLDHKAIGRKVLVHRKTLGLSQEQLGKIVFEERDNASKFVYRVERGIQELRLSQAIVVCNLFGITLQELLAGAEPEPPKEKLPFSRQREWQIRNPLKAKVQRYAYENSDKKSVVYECNCAATDKEDHHFDYEKHPLDVVRLCPACHAAWHTKLRKLTSQPQALSVPASPEVQP